ncbi:MAG: response regulator transcription factor [Saprospiraceae bacterium]|nr:response regulator transcription factor [Saprospiraceae bacterium]
MIHLLIADDHQVLLDGFISIFDDIDDIEVVGTARNGQEVLDFLSDNETDVVLLDINMPVLNGVETCKQITKKYPHLHVVALSMYDQQSYFKRMIQYGAKGYLLKNDSVEEIERAIRQVMDGSRYISSQLQSMLSSVDFMAGNNKPRFGSEISPRELEVLQLVAEGHTDQEIASQLFISHHTVNTHRKKLLTKFDAKNTAELIKKAMEKGVI